MRSRVAVLPLGATNGHVNLIRTSLFPRRAEGSYWAVRLGSRRAPPQHSRIPSVSPRDQSFRAVGARRSRPRCCPRTRSGRWLRLGGGCLGARAWFSPRCKLVRNRLNLARDLTELERIVGLHGCERRSLAPPTVKQFPNRGHSITVMGFRILRDLQQDLGKTQRRPAQTSRTVFASPLGRPPGLPDWPGLKPLPVMPPGRVVSWLFSTMLMCSSIARDAVETWGRRLPPRSERPSRWNLCEGRVDQGRRPRREIARARPCTRNGR